MTKVGKLQQHYAKGSELGAGEGGAWPLPSALMVSDLSDLLCDSGEVFVPLWVRF